MKLLSKISLRPKLILLVLLPFSFLGYFTFDKIEKEQELISQNEIVRQKIDLIARASVLMHELQIERDYAVNYILNPIYESQVQHTKQIEATDSTLKQFRTYLYTNNLDTSYLALFGELKSTRADITWFNVSSSEVEEYFTLVINRFLDIVTRVSSEARTTKTKEEIVSFISLLNSKENLGRIRNKVNEAFIFNKFQGLGYGQFAGYKGAFESNLNEFIKYAPDELKQRFKLDFQGGSISNTLEMIDYCFENGNGRLTAFNSESWWLSVTGTLNILHELELFVLNRISDNIKVRELELQENIDNLYLFLTGTLTFLLLLVSFTIRSITSQLKRIQKAAYSIQLGDTSVTIPVNTNDEIGKLAEGFNTMASTANILANAAESIGNGNLDVEIEPRSENDVLGVSLKSMKENLKATRIELRSKLNELESAYKYKSDFLANMSHELRTPLNSLLILSDLLSANTEKNLNADQIESLNVINRSGNNLLSLINDILDLSKIEAGKLDVNLEVIELEKVLQVVKDVFHPLTASKKIEFKVDVEENVAKTFQSDELRLGQVLKNLISNAVKFTPENGKVELIIKHENENISFLVKDNGIGIPLDKQETIFEAFKQADGSTSRNYGGTGLGLSITKNLVTLLGGEIFIESTPDIGSEFKIVFPLVGPETIEVVKEVEVEVIKEIPKGTSIKTGKPFLSSDFNGKLEGVKLLLIEEDISNVFEIGSKLGDTKVELVEASSLEEIKEKIKENIDYILLNPEGFGSEDVDSFLELIDHSKIKTFVSQDVKVSNNCIVLKSDDKMNEIVTQMTQNI